MTFTAAGRTATGPRPLNQDWLDWDVDLGLFMVADGMGGHNAGEVAARLAVQSIRAFVADSARGNRAGWPCEYEAGLSHDLNRLLAAVRLANRRVHDQGVAHAAFEGMGTTIVAVLVTGDRAAMVSVGDSRIYLWRHGRLAQLTSDDSWLSVILGMPDDERARSRHPMRHVLTSVVGMRDDLRPAVHEQALERGDRLILSSDGVHGCLGPSDIASVLGRGGPSAALAAALVDAALARGTTDNATALVVAVE